MVPWLLGVVFVVIPIVGNNAIRATGDAKTPGKIMVIMAVINALLDPILIFGLGPFPELGIKGAAISTVISYFIIMIVGFWILGVKELLQIGIPAMLTQLLIPISFAILTRIAANLGNATVAAFGVGSRIESIAMIGLIALSAVIIPFLGQNFGAKNFDRIKEANRFSLIFALVWGTISWVFLGLLSEIIAWAFSKDMVVQELIKDFLWIVPFSFAFQGISQLISASCNALGRPFHSTTLNIIRLFVFLIPSAYTGANIWGSTGFFLGITIGNLFTGIISWFWFKNIILPSSLNDE